MKKIKNNLIGIRDIIQNLSKDKSCDHSEAWSLILGGVIFE